MSYTYYRRYQSPRGAKRRSSGFNSFFMVVIVLVVSVLVLKACISVASNLRDDRSDEAVLSVSKGTVEVKEWGAGEFEQAQDSQLILVGDEVQTEDNSWATLRFLNGTELRLDEGTRVLFETAEDTGRLGLILVEGRVWMKQEPKNDLELEILLKTEVMNLISTRASYWATQLDQTESVIVQDGSIEVEYVERGPEDVVIESTALSQGYMSFFEPEKRRALLDRGDIELIEKYEPLEEEAVDDFLAWNRGQISVQEEDEEKPVEEPEDEEEVIEEEPIVEEEEVPEETPVVVEPALKISISSPKNPSTIQKDAIAIEGSILSGEAESVYVTWSGSGTPYALSMYEAGASSFRYVASLDYQNLKAGRNEYTIVAYDAEGKESNRATVVITVDI